MDDFEFGRMIEFIARKAETRCITQARDHVNDIADDLSLITGHAAELNLPKEPELMAAIINLRIAERQLDAALKKRAERSENGKL